ncbi:hypothetical protein U1Q18_000105 [Sarracenia purpurea var. burkii]
MQRRKAMAKIISSHRISASARILCITTEKTPNSGGDSSSMLTDELRRQLGWPEDWRFGEERSICCKNLRKNSPACVPTREERSVTNPCSTLGRHRSGFGGENLETKLVGASDLDLEINQ